MMVRRLLDLFAATVGGVFVAPLAIVVGLAVRGTMGKPVFFVQQRSGQGGRAFPMIKFRTMSDDRGPDGTLLGDRERVTRLGRFLRRSRLDELPELWNIMTGDMALIGPRPLLPTTINALGEAGRRRGAFKPGLTGWAQVNGNTLLEEADKIALDLWYVAHASLWLDLRIIAKTVMMILFGEKIDRQQLGRAYAGCADRRG
jgi:lipopolysaccharide/colanic/teichoic acid biosynthesis glycosyltransferase